MASLVIDTVDMQLISQLDSKGLKRKSGRPSKASKKSLQGEAQSRYGLRSNVKPN